MFEPRDSSQPTPSRHRLQDARVARAASLPAGVERLAELARIDPLGLNPFDRLEVLALWEQCQCWLAAGQAEAVAAAASYGLWSDEQQQYAEAARATLIPAGTAPRRNVVTALMLTKHPVIAARLRGGRVSYEQVHAVLTETARLALDEAREIALDLLDDAAMVAPAVLRREARRRVIAADPLRSELEAERGHALRHLRRRSHPDGQGEITVLGPAAGIATIWNALDLTATAAGQGAGAADDRTLDQRRFDALVDLATDRLLGPPALLGPPVGADDAPGRDCTGAAGVRAGASASRRRGSRRGLRPTIYLYGDVRTWAGLADLPFDLDGHGPVPAGVARAMFADAAFRVVVTDAIGRVGAVSENQYVPSPRLRRHLHVTDRTCGFPGCGAAVWFCDVEHCTPHDQGGATDSDNCGLVCRRHHRLKTFGGWSWYRDPLGRTVWTSPDGHHFHRDPTRYRAEEAEAEALRRFLREENRPPPRPPDRRVPDPEPAGPPPF